MRVAIILPSRGLIFSRTLEQILNNASKHAYRIYWSHGRKIPECFNKPLQQALKDPHNTHFWIIEEDMIIPDGILSKMLEMNVPAVTADYPLTSDGASSIKKDLDEKIYLCGTGCLLLTREFISEYKNPIFRSDILFNIKNYRDYIELSPYKTNSNQVYGIHDMLFSLLAYLRGNPITLCNMACGQYKLISSGGRGVNSGLHQIEEWNKITPFHKLENIHPDIDDMIVKMADDTELIVSKEHGLKMINNKLAQEVKREYIYIADNSLLYSII